jgi:hypothetical protein
VGILVLAVLVVMVGIIVKDQVLRVHLELVALAVEVAVAVTDLVEALAVALEF